MASVSVSFPSYTSHTRRGALERLLAKDLDDQIFHCGDFFSRYPNGDKDVEKILGEYGVVDI